MDRFTTAKFESLITWNDNFSVSIPQFDQEHQQLIAMINSLHEAMKQGTGKKAMGTLLDDLTNYASTHFSHEEQMMVQYSYPDFKKHKQSHVDFAQTIKEYRTLYENSSLSAGNLLNLLQSWLINHICDTDKQYTAFLREYTKMVHFLYLYQNTVRFRSEYLYHVYVKNLRN